MKLARACYDLAVPDLERAVALRPQKPQAYVNLADVHRRCGRWEQALPQLDRAIALAPSADLYRTRAGLHEKQEAYVEALPDLENAIRYDRVIHRLDVAADDELQRGRILLRLGNYAAALQAADRALADAPDLLAAHQLRGEALLELGRIAEAVEALDRFLAKGPASAVASRARALGRAKLGNYAGAIEDYTYALQVDRGNGLARRPRNAGLSRLGLLGRGGPATGVEGLQHKPCSFRDVGGRTVSPAAAKQNSSWGGGSRPWPTPRPSSKRRRSRRTPCTAPPESMPRRL